MREEKENKSKQIPTLPSTMQTSQQPPPANTTSAATTKDNKTIYILLATSFFSLLFIFSLSSTSSSSSSSNSALSSTDPLLFPSQQTRSTIFLNPNPSDPNPSPPAPPSIAYFITGGAGEGDWISRLLFAAYHPRNHYLIHLDLTASQSERASLALTLQSVPIFRAANNVNVIGNADFAYSKGSSAISSTLHGAAILLRLSPNWDWFINLSAGDYPLVTQDGIFLYFCWHYLLSIFFYYVLYSFCDLRFHGVRSSSHFLLPSERS